jgi:hypothetical protein
MRIPKEFEFTLDQSSPDLNGAQVARYLVKHLSIFQPNLYVKSVKIVEIFKSRIKN